MNIKNYTTEVPASRSIDNIEKLLIDFGATNINKQYANGQCTGIAFIVEMDGMKLPFRLPAKVDNIFRWLKKKRPNSQEKTLKEQAVRVSWKLQHEWLHLQLSLIEMDQLEKMEAFFPYLLDIRQDLTYYEKLKSEGFKQLTNG